MGEGVTNWPVHIFEKRVVPTCSVLLLVVVDASWREDKRWKGLWMTGDQQYTRANLPPTTQHKHILRACMVCVSCHAQSYVT